MSYCACTTILDLSIKRLDLKLRTGSDRKLIIQWCFIDTYTSLYSLRLGVFQDFTKLKVDTQANAAWTPVVAQILQGFVKFEDKAFMRYLPAIYPLETELLARDIAPEVQEGLQEYFTRVGYAQGIMYSPPSRIYTFPTWITPPITPLRHIKNPNMPI
ncbi:hypothetical protein QCA50_019406 [Cerrena zonata]|uniref:Sec7/BIG1-like C-terminal domain-containing protein n=1 Tax=Cerrena zonata TaxID=2478898 RepID=A0AAW0F964_9APHY